MRVLKALLLVVAVDSLQLKNDALTVTFGDRGITSVALHSSNASWTFAHEAFTLKLGSILLSSDTLPPPIVKANATHVEFDYLSVDDVFISATYSLQAPAAVGKQLYVNAAGFSEVMNVSKVSPFSAVVITQFGMATESLVSHSHHGLGDYAMFKRFKGHGVLLTVQNPYLMIGALKGSDATTVAYNPAMNCTADGSFTADEAIISFYRLSGRILKAPADPLDDAEQDAMVAAVRNTLVVKQNQQATVKLNIGWTENDYQAHSLCVHMIYEDIWTRLIK